ncbi:hypothetical protein CY34DRAFT_19823 [Suillus luteus UH-Slu-Lm8-n1]|uniref:Uncharacterized protein n=1 Tax=Suillus luteus UH-Slu-Lm8-n1 TaxID=930992 RepID=A0A0D0A067_9AGAM|nr:hypothetical protein CY34DRAFT_19823 [Suillus luteus UH-Slu-Lm8-n1]
MSEYPVDVVRSPAQCMIDRAPSHRRQQRVAECDPLKVVAYAGRSGNCLQFTDQLDRAGLNEKRSESYARIPYQPYIHRHVALHCAYRIYFEVEPMGGVWREGLSWFRLSA